MTVLGIDFESRSAIDLKRSGVHRYAADPSTDLWCACYAFDDEPVETWVPGEPCPDRIRRHVLDGEPLFAFNAGFERVMWQSILGPRYGWPVPKLEQWEDTAAWGAAMGLPRGLGDAARAMGLPQEKDDEGHRLMLRMSKPRKARKSETADGLLWWDDADRVERLLAYCRQDVEAERALRKALFPLQEQERETWLFDQRMNDRGVRIDLELVHSLHKLGAWAAERLDAEMAEATGGWVTACTQVNRLTEWLRDVQGAPATSLAKAALEEMLLSDLPPDARRAVEIRQLAAKTSTKKLDAMLACVDDDGRARGQHLYYGAGTGRWAGRLIQVQNMPRGTGTVTDPDAAAADFMDGRPELIQFQYGAPMNAVSDMLRACFVASPGHRLLVADFSAIEGRVTAWLAGEEHEVQAYRDADRGIGSEIYKIAAGGIFNVAPAEVTKAQRQVGKVACIAEGQPVLTLSGLKPIQEVLPTDEIWDGEAWVGHEGVVFQGVRDVWEYDGLVATEDHIVFTEDGRTLPFGACARQQIRLAQTGLGREAVRLGDGHRPGDHLEGQGGQARTQEPVQALASPMQRLRRQKADFHAQLTRGQVERVPKLLAKAPGAQMGREADECGEVTLREHRGPRLSAVRGQGHSVSLRIPDSRGPMGNGAPRPPARLGDRPDRQRRALRTGEPPLGYAVGAEPKPTPQQNTQSPKLAEPLFASDDGPAAARRVLGRRDSGDGRAGGSGAPQELARYRGQARVYDIVNAGPRHRFTVSGRLVHNCLALGFQGGVMAFNSMAAIYRVNMADAYEPLLASTDTKTWERAEKRYAECLERQDTGTDVMTREAWIASEVTKVLWREKHPATQALWRGLEEAAFDAVLHPGATFSFRGIDYVVGRGFLWCKLPSGRVLAYGGPKISERETPWGERKSVVTVLGVDSVTRRWSRYALYGGLATENCIQAIARDLIRDGMLAAEAAGYPIVLTVHDEAVADVPNGFGSLAEFERLLCSKGPWADGLPVVAEGYEAQRYRK